ncbi:hypothetical protein K431DRAFT_276652 [Polychaeton citri CBS 116435]|uniref:Uncharacterized protein n=1 Tax=Polychaeton citri CBS 116435 TaxID=1314669 RepID=A0A9P4UL89_9PEZI|nr:hypothetical protein K431DRAFT_276652 [Polychaeton citri CBS 116435]
MSGDQSRFFDRVSPNVEWDVTGTRPVAGSFRSLEEWEQGALGVVNNILTEPLKLQIRNVVRGGQ